MRRNHIIFLYNPGHLTFRCVEVGPVANAKDGSTQENDWVIMLSLLTKGVSFYNHHWQYWENLWYVVDKPFYLNASMGNLFLTNEWA